MEELWQMGVRQLLEDAELTVDRAITLDLINREQNLSFWVKERTPALLKTGVVERAARKLILSRAFYEFTDKKGVYTRKRGLDRETNKQFLLKHIRENAKNGSCLRN